MKSKTIKQFDTLNSEELAIVEGGGCNRIDGGKAVLAGGLGSATVGFFTGGPVGAAVGWHFGAISGGVAYYGTCWIG